MNKERLDQIATWLENGAKHERVSFDITTGISITQESYDPAKHYECKTVCCIAGAAVQFFTPKDALQQLFASELPYIIAPEDDDYGDDYSLSWEKVFHRALVLLDLTHNQARDLFSPGNLGMITSENLDDYNDPAWAARTIRHLIATGEVNWKATRQ